MKFRFHSYGITAATIAVSCMAPMCLGAQNRANASAAAAAIKAAAAKPTPRAADGHPDLNGYWIYPEFDKSAHLDSNGNFYIDVPPDKGGTLPKLDASLSEQLQHQVDPNPPPYKPEAWAKVKELASDGVHTDPAFRCRPLGVPRAGAPRQIVQTPKLTLILYQIDAGDGDQPGSYRLVPTDGRPHRTDVDPSYFGDSIGHWEGDTLVVDVTHFNDDTWLAAIPGQGGSGYFHTEALHVVERYTRTGDTLRWEATVEDPNVLTKPWKMTPQTEVLTQDMIYEQPICEERETPHIVNQY
ncbi:MAG: hypothetical protein DMG32_25005 [Acidobacteria bacterium]|nr:MAG: hypothetical protein DMG32_25005 [Acidobacteriota bacterium]